ncbi:uncharacterized protein LOC107611120 [Arachis ipaensis]|uniref:uncharacterized protein LOC107611120 n=1 Tax=Arachis ipaensis TaxID=130454 RepID=UPI0007AF9250|nr:uncharacterized protein LOC107611120 [Arachis ipaensis]
MAAAMQATTEVLGQQANNGNGGYGGNGPMALATFLKVNSLIFRETTNPTEADNWFQVMKRALQAQHVSEDQYVEFATCQLIGEARYWWQEVHRLLQLGNAVISWEIFQSKFYKKYFSNLVRVAKELELLQLKQGSMTVAKYTSMFEEFCQFFKVCRDAAEDYEE